MRSKAAKVLDDQLQEGPEANFASKSGRQKLMTELDFKPGTSATFV